MLLSLMYHNINSDKYTNNLEIFEKHLKYIKENFNIVLPGDSLGKKNICLVFDDGYYNFYNYVFPLLKELNIKMMFAIPTAFILDVTKVEKKKRLNIKHDEAEQNVEYAPYCTYEELKEMSDSGLVKIASHSVNHVDLTKANNLILELNDSKKNLEKKINIKCDSLVLPFGKYDEKVISEAKKIYKYIFRIGNGINKDFLGIKGLIYRVSADNLKNEKDIFSWQNMLKYRLKSFLKSF